MKESSYVSKLLSVVRPSHASPSVSMAPAVICLYFLLGLVVLGVEWKNAIFPYTKEKDKERDPSQCWRHVM